MSDLRDMRWAIVAVVVGLLMAAQAQCGPPIAHAGPTQTLQPGEQCVARPVTVPSLVVSAVSSAHRLADTRAAKRCGAALSECTRRVVRATRLEPQWRVAVRWTLTGLALGGAFWAGAKIGGR